MVGNVCLFLHFLSSHKKEKIGIMQIFNFDFFKIKNDFFKTKIGKIGITTCQFNLVEKLQTLKNKL